MRLLVLFTLAAMMLAPGARAEGDPLCIIFFEPSQDFRLIDVKADLILTPDERANISRAVDTDADGILTAAEVSNYENSTVDVMTTLEQYGERLLYLDGNLPTQLTVWTKLRNWTGPVEEARKGVVTELREYHTVPIEDVGHLLTGGLYAVPDTLQRRRPVIETIVLTAPEGWVVHSVGHVPKAETNTTATPMPTYAYVNPTLYQQKSITLSAFDIRQQYEVTFAKEGEEPYYATGSPMPGIALVLAAIAVLAFLVRRS